LATLLKTASSREDWLRISTNQKQNSGIFVTSNLRVQLKSIFKILNIAVTVYFPETTGDPFIVIAGVSSLCKSLIECQNKGDLKIVFLNVTYP